MLNEKELNNLMEILNESAKQDPDNIDKPMSEELRAKLINEINKGK